MPALLYDPNAGPVPVPPVRSARPRLPPGGALPSAEADERELANLPEPCGGGLLGRWRRTDPSEATATRRVRTVSSPDALSNQPGEGDAPEPLGYDDIEFRDLASFNGQVRRGLEPACVSVRGYLSSYTGLTPAMLFPDRTVTWNYAILSTGMLPEKARSRFVRECRGICEVQVKGLILPPRSGKPHMQVHALSVLR